MEEAANRGLAVAAHAHGAEGIKNAVAAGVRSIEHGGLMDEESMRLMKEGGTFLVADLLAAHYDLVETDQDWTDKQVPDNRAEYERYAERLGQAYRVGVRMAFGTDSGIYPHGRNAEQFEADGGGRCLTDRRYSLGDSRSGGAPRYRRQGRQSGGRQMGGSDRSEGRSAEGRDDAHGGLLRDEGRRRLQVAAGMRTVAALIGFALLACPFSLAGEGPIIDMHLHAFGWDEYGDPPPPGEVTGERPAARSDEQAVAGTLAELDRHGIVLGVASGPRERVEEWLRVAPGRFLGGIHVGARDPLPELEELREAISTGRVAVLGELGLQYRGISPDDPGLEPYFALAEELDVPVALHTGVGDAGTPHGCCPDFRTTLGNPALVEEVLVRHPKLRVNLMHAGWPWLQETLAVLYVYPQVYVDIGVLGWSLPRGEFERYLGALVTAGFGKRILFGSDQMIWPRMIGRSVAAVEAATFLSEEQRRDIFYWNAARFLRLSRDEIERHHRSVGATLPPS